MVILTVVDQFSKMYHLIALPKLLIVQKLASFLVTLIFRYYGIPEGIVSDWRLQFTSQVFTFLVVSLLYET